MNNERERNSFMKECIIRTHIACIIVVMAAILQYFNMRLQDVMKAYFIYFSIILFLFYLEIRILTVFESHNSDFISQRKRSLYLKGFYIGFPLALALVIVFLTENRVPYVATILFLPVIIAGSLAGKRPAYFVTVIGAVILVTQELLFTNIGIRGIIVENLILVSGMGVVGWFSGNMSDMEEDYNLERARNANEIARDKELLSVTLRSIGEGVIATDVSGRITMMNEFAERMTGFKMEEVYGIYLGKAMEVLNASDGDMIDDPVHLIVRGKGIMEMNDYRLINRYGHEYRVEGSGAPIRDTSGKIIGVVIVFRDVTEKKRMENEMLKANKMESLGVLAGGLAHDFNNLLTVIGGNISLARMVTSQDDIAEILVEGERAAQQAKQITQQLMTIARGNAPVKKTASIARLVTQSTGFALCGSWVQAELIMPPDLFPVDVDEGQIDQVLSNLIINSIQAMPDGGTIKIKGENVVLEDGHIPYLRAGRYVKLSVTDNGGGIAESIKEKVFDPYFTTKTTGSGLGLSSCYSILKNHGGHIDLDSVLGIGTTFYIYLPASVGLIKEEVIESKLSRGNGNILIMDDDVRIRVMLTQMLEKAGYRVQSARDGQEAVEKYWEAKQSETPFDAVIMDLTVPGGMGGKEAFKLLNSIDPNIKVIISSGYSDDPVVTEYSNYGFAGVITKPYRVDELTHVLGLTINPQLKEA
ncbi:MAG: ATP-binding protein [Chitinophagales bacterium]